MVMVAMAVMIVMVAMVIVVMMMVVMVMAIMIAAADVSNVVLTPKTNKGKAPATGGKSSKKKG